MKTLFLAWQDPHTRRWVPIGRLTRPGTHYQFVYTCGAERAERTLGFRPLEAFPDLHLLYESDELFPLFLNRLPSQSRPDYRQFIEYLNVPRHEDDPMALLARTAGRRATDSLEVFPLPKRDPAGRYHIHFFAHGIRHLPQSSLDRINKLEPRERLNLAADLQNPVEPRALMLRTAESFEGDIHIVGYCPRYLVPDIWSLLKMDPDSVLVQVEQVNHAPAPQQLRLLCRLEAPWPEGFQPLGGEEYEPLVNGDGASE